MTITKSRENAVLTVKVDGRLDTTTSPELEASVMNDLDGVNEAVLDFSGLEYISSSGLRTLLKIQRVMEERGGLKVTNVSELVAEVFEITGFDEILTVE